MQLKCLGNRRRAHGGSYPGFARAATSHVSGRDNRLKFRFKNLETAEKPLAGRGEG